MNKQFAAVLLAGLIVGVTLGFIASLYTAHEHCWYDLALSASRCKVFG